ncbi:hypothetical protein P7L53_14575 [Thermoleptolyngbya sichuanensis XZ-Cy5]|uniref:hypothetical protein n=1 Tax=Thermoleptolyngbya sichuanensis TaxID=2885951 RepID=UPI00240E8C12|nr:hypothetical protein [Thermoleptolyngbya sichuanensis]MDG2617463.1 hypothetical protein [Thermoleptolyngbya sichuanensis XZ-Cy5]
MNSFSTKALQNGSAAPEFEDEFGRRGQAGRSIAQRFAAYLKRQGFLPTVHFTQRFLKRLASKGVRFDPRTFVREFRAAKHYRQTRPGYNTRLTVVRGVPIVYRPGGENGNRIVLVTALEQGVDLPPVARTAPPKQREAEWELESEFEWEFESKLEREFESKLEQIIVSNTPRSFDARVQQQYLETLQETAAEREADPFVVEDIKRRIPPGHETLNREAAKGLPITPAELNAMNRGVRRVDLEKITNHFKPSQQRRHMLRRHKCQSLEEALAEARQQLVAIYQRIMAAPTREAAFEWLGEALHLIQDSYSSAHTERENGGAGAIRFIRYFGMGGLSYPHEHRVMPMRQPNGRVFFGDPRDYINLSNMPTRAAIAASRRFIQLVLRHLQAAVSSPAHQAELKQFMDSVLVLSPRRTPTKSLYPRCP